jgi:PPOX class probable F420-dependent enzyme
MAEDARPTPSGELVGSEVLAAPLVRELVAQRIVAVLGTLNDDGSIHVVPMWFADAGDALVLATGRASRKVRNLERDSRATLMLHDSRAGFEVFGVSMSGRAEIVRAPAAQPLVDRVHRKYVSRDGSRLPPVAEFLASDDVALRFVPERALLWDERPSLAATALTAAGGAHPLVPTSPRERGQSSSS